MTATTFATEPSFNSYKLRNIFCDFLNRKARQNRETIPILWTKLVQIYLSKKAIDLDFICRKLNLLPGYVKTNEDALHPLVVATMLQHYDYVIPNFAPERTYYEGVLQNSLDLDFNTFSLIKRLMKIRYSFGIEPKLEKCSPYIYMHDLNISQICMPYDWWTTRMDLMVFETSVPLDLFLKRQISIIRYLNSRAKTGQLFLSPYYKTKYEEAAIANLERFCSDNSFVHNDPETVKVLFGY